jgi:uncharacterized protein with HEPN domain
MWQSDPGPWLQDILEAITGVRAAVGGMSLEDYCASWTTRRATERAIEIISEASRHLPQSLHASEPDVPWREIASIGNVLRHAYHRVDGDLRHREPPARPAGGGRPPAVRSAGRRRCRLRARTGASRAS